MSISVDAKTFEAFLGGFTPEPKLTPLFKAFFEISLLINGIKNSTEIKQTSGIAKYDFVDAWTKLQALPGMVTFGSYYLILHLEEMYVLLSKVFLVEPDDLANIAKYIKALASLKSELRALEIESISH